MMSMATIMIRFVVEFGFVFYPDPVLTEIHTDEHIKMVDGAPVHGGVGKCISVNI